MIGSVMDVFLDEAGYTGSDLINEDQPVFILASTIVDALEARALLDSHFDKPQPEVKYVKRAKSHRGRSQILEFLRALKVDCRRVAFFSFHKEYLLLTNLIDFWLEPMMFEDGVNLLRARSEHRSCKCLLSDTRSLPRPRRSPGASQAVPSHDP
jgi:hypothetical protein